MSLTMLQCNDLTKQYIRKGKAIKVLNGINFAVAKSEICVILGRSGVGKSTLIGLLSGLDKPTTGDVIFEDFSLTKAAENKLTLLRREKMGIIFQTHNLLPSWNAFENVEAAIIHSNLTKTARNRKVTSLLKRLGLAERMWNLPSELSVGQQQRVAIARALVGDPALILADQPTGDVDEETAQEIINLLVEMVKEKGASLLVTTHHNFPLRMADRVLKLEQGRLFEWEKDNKHDQKII